MNIRADISLATTPPPCPVLPGSLEGPAAQATVVPLAGRLAAVAFDDADAAGAGSRLTALLDGEVLSRPLISTRLELRRGGRRHVLLLGLGAEELVRRRLTLALGARLAAALDPAWLQSPLGELSALIDGVSEAGKRRLLKFFLTSGASLFRDCRTPAFAAAMADLIGLMALRSAELGCWTPLGDSARILSFRAPDGPSARITELVALSSRGVSRLPRFELRSEASSRSHLLHVFLPRPIAADAMLIGIGDTTVAFRVHAEAPSPQPLASWLGRRDAATRRWGRERIEGVADVDPAADVLFREICQDGEAQPGIEIRHLSGTPGGVLVALTLHDPHGLVRAIRVERGGASREIAVRKGASAVSGFARLPRRSRLDDACRLSLIYGSGRTRKVHEGRLEPFTGAIPAGLDPAAAPSIAAARLTMARRALAVTIETVGSPPKDAAISVVVGAGGNLDLFRARAAMLAREPGARRVELVYHLAEGGAAEAVRRAAAQAAAVFGVAHRLVTLPADTDPTERLFSVLGATTAPAVLVLGDAVLPEKPGWLASWMRALRDGHGRAAMVGGTVLNADGSVLDAGGRLRTCASGAAMRIERRCAGLPARDLPRAATAATDLVTADCIGLTRRAVAVLTSLGVHYPDPDLPLAEAARRLGAIGSSTRTEFRARFIRYDAAPHPDPLAGAIEHHALDAIRAGDFGAMA